MKIPRFILAGSLLVALPAILTSLSLRAAPAAENVLIDFTDVRVDHISGETTKSYEFAWDDWGKHITDLPGKGCLIQSPTNKGTLGENRPSLPFDKTPIVGLDFVVGNANHAKLINFILEDSDGTEQGWTISFENMSKGQLHRVPLDLTKCTYENKPGKKPGLNFKKLASWKISGDWSDPNLEVLLVKLVAPKS